MPTNNLIQIRKGTSTEWTTANPVLASGEPGFDLTNRTLKIGNGSTSWTNLSSVVTEEITTSVTAGSGIDLSYNALNDTLTISATGVSYSGHTHTSSNIVDFNSVVSGLIPVKNIINGPYINIISTTGNFTITATGLQPSGSYANSVHTHTSSDITNFNSSVSGLLPTISNSGNNRVLISNGSTTGISAQSNLTFDGTNLSSPYFISTNSTGDEGGEIQLAKPATNSAISGTITIDIYQNKLRFFEQSGSNRGYYLDLSTGVAGVGTQLEAKSKTISVFTPNQNQPPATNFATIDTRNSIFVLEFDATTEESAYFTGVIDEGRSLTNGITVRLWWMADTATTGNVRWGVQFEKTGTDLDADSFATNAQATGAASGTSGIETVTSIGITTIDSLSAGDRYRLRVYRVAADATNDTMVGDAQLVAVEVRAT